jgi:hypothetical protein
MNNKLLRMTSCIAACLSLFACGGGGSNGSGGADSTGGTQLSNETAAGSPQGAYTGRTSSGSDFNAIILENNQYYILYGTTSNNVLGVGGFLTGSAQAKEGKFISADLKDFGQNGLIHSGSINASYKAGTSFSGTASNGAATISFDGTPIPNSIYNYNAAPNLDNIAGSWNMVNLDGTSVTLDIAPSGQFTAVYDSGNCDFEGTLVPRSSGKNVFDFELTGGSGSMGYACELVGPTTVGHAVDFALANGTRQLIIAATDSDSPKAALLIGAR